MFSIDLFPFGWLQDFRNMPKTYMFIQRKVFQVWKHIDETCAKLITLKRPRNHVGASWTDMIRYIVTLATWINLRYYFTWMDYSDSTCQATYNKNATRGYVSVTFSWFEAYNYNLTNPVVWILEKRWKKVRLHVFSSSYMCRNILLLLSN